MSELIEAMLERVDKGGGRASAAACAAWAEVAGPAGAEHSKAIKLTEGELLVAVDSPAWANEMSLMREHYLAALRERVGKDSVKSIRFTVSKQAAVRKSRPGSPAPGADKRAEPRVQLEDAATRAQVAAKVSDPKLQDAIVKALSAARRARASESHDTRSDQRR